MKSMMLLFLVGLVVADGLLTLTDKDKQQIRGLKKLLSNLDGVYPTCNLVLFSELVDYGTADERCKSFDIGSGGDVKGNLATVNDEGKNKDLKLLLEMAYPESDGKWSDNEWVWVGLRKTKNNEGDKKDRKYNAQDWNWADGSQPIDYQMWMRGQPDQKPQKDGKEKLLQNQMRINHDGKWDDTFAYKTHPYACDYQGKYILSATPKAWSDANTACMDAGLEMAKVRNDAEVKEIQQAAVYFLGEYDESSKIWDQFNWIWLGANDATIEGTWAWNDGEALDATWYANMPWREPNPDNSDRINGGRTQNYLAISKWGEFDDSFDSPKRQRPFACQCPGT